MTECKRSGSLMLACPPLLRCLCAASMLIVLSNRASSQEQNFADRLFPPELVMQHRSDLQLSGEQVQKITQIIGQFSQKATNAQDRAEQHSQELARLLDAKSTSEAETLQQLKSYLSAEQERQQAHYSALLRIRGLLTAEQRSLLSTIRKTRPPQRSAQQAIPPAAGPTEQRLRARRDQIQQIVQSRATRGIPSDSVGRLMQQFSEHIQQGRVREAEATLDRALQSLRQQDGPTPPKRNDPQDAMLSRPPETINRLTAQPRRSSAELRAAVRKLHVDDVAWRKIAWETSLVQGLKRSRAERRPLVLWVFIDRPIDDERC